MGQLREHGALWVTVLTDSSDSEVEKLIATESDSGKSPMARQTVQIPRSRSGSSV